MKHTLRVIIALAALSVAPLAHAKSYMNVTLNGQNFSRQPLQNSSFTNSEFNDSQFRGSDLSGSSFMNTSLNGADFSGAILRDVSFTNVELNGANFAGARFENVRFMNVELSGTRFERNHMSQIDMVNSATDEIVWIDAMVAAPPPPAVIVQYAPRQLVKAQELTVALAEPGHKVDLTVNFEFNSDKILAAGHAQVDEIAQALKSPTLARARIRVEGHTDAKGSDKYNEDLSYRRAASVKRALTEQYGINGHNLSVHGFGESQPVADNDTDEGRALNRRVTLVNTGK